MENLAKLMGLFNDPDLQNGFKNINEPGKKHQVSTRIFKVLNDKGAIIKIDGVNHFSPDFNFTENFAKRIISDSQDLKRFQDAKDAVRKRFENALLSTDSHPFDLEDWWQMVGYAEKRNAKRALESLKLGEKDVLYRRNGEKSDGKDVLTGRPAECVLMSKRAFSHFCMAAQTYMGMVVRDFFYDVYEELDAMKKGKAASSNNLYMVLEKHSDLKRFKQVVGKAESDLKALANDVFLDQRDDKSNKLMAVRVEKPEQASNEILALLKEAIEDYLNTINL